MKKAINILGWLFLIIGIFFALSVLITIFYDNKITVSVLDWKYIEKISYSLNIIAVLFTGAGTFAIFLTLIKQQEQFNKSQEQIETQQFESTFFSMLNQFFNIKNNINGLINNKTFEGQNYIHEVLNNLKTNYDLHISSHFEINSTLQDIIACNLPVSSKITMLKDDLNVKYLEEYKFHHSQLGHFFRYFYNMLKFVIENRENEKFSDASKYIQIIQAQLSNDELGLIFCNTISDKALGSKGNSKLLEWLDYYSFLENIDRDSLLHRSLYILYPKTKFKFLNVDEKIMFGKLLN